MNPTDERHTATSPSTLLSRPETNSVQEAQRKQGIKFALFTRNTRREQGGEFTFESEILRAWLNAPSHHHTTICTLGKVLPLGLDLNGAQHISLDFPITRRIQMKLGLEYRLLLERVRLRRPIHKRLHDAGHRLATLRLNSHGVRFIWYLSPWSVPLPDIPYAVTVWDLQHRLQPFFPEVSAGMEWFRREDHLKQVLQQASFVITGTNRGKSEIEHFYGIDSSRIRIVPLPTPSFAFQEETDAEMCAFRKLNVPARYLFYPAQFWPHKNHAVLLHMLRILKEAGAEPTGLVFVGSRPRKQKPH